MEAVLGLMCRITYSPGNLKSLLERGKRVQNKAVLMKIIERNTGISGEDTIEASRRCDKMVAEDIMAAYQAKGSRGKDLALPPNFEKDGPYDYELVGCECTVRNKFENTTAMVIVPRLATLYIDLPWSESRAVLRQKNGNFRKSMAEIFNQSATALEPAGAQPVPPQGLCQSRFPRHPKKGAAAPNITTPPPTPRSWERSPDTQLEESQDMLEGLDLFDDKDGAIHFMEGYLSFDY